MVSVLQKITRLVILVLETVLANPLKFAPLEIVKKIPVEMGHVKQLKAKIVLRVQKTVLVAAKISATPQPNYV